MTTVVRLEENNNFLIPYYLQQNSFLSAKYTLISNYYENRRRLKHIYLKCILINKTNESVKLTSITQGSLGKYTVLPGHSMLAHHRNVVDRDSDRNEDV